MTTASSNQGHYAGAIAILAGLATATLIYRHPEHLLVPVWVAYAACLAFVFAGWALIAQASSGRRYYRWLLVGLLGSMLVPPFWAAFGRSAQSCSAAIIGVGFIPSEAFCRLAWGASAAVLLAIFIWAIRWAMAKPKAD